MDARGASSDQERLDEIFAALNRGAKITTVHRYCEVTAEHIGPEGQRVIDDFRVVERWVCPSPPGGCACPDRLNG